MVIVMARQRPSSNRFRVILSDGGDPVSLWSTVDGDTVTLDHEYPDFHPAPGWLVEVQGRHLVIDTVEGRQLNCRPY